MAKPQNIEVYRDWLGITETNRPLNYYQLLRLKKFEDDTALIRAHYQRMNAHVRKFQTIEPERVQALLDELTKAMLCLTDTHRKGDYDGTLGRAGGAERKKRSLEDLLLTRKILDQEQLKKAQNMANAIGVDLRDAVMQQKLAKPEVIMQAYADSLGLPFLDLSIMQIDLALVPKMPAVMARQHSCVPLLVDDDKVIVASPNPLRQEIEDEVRLRFGMPVKTVLCSPADIHDAISKHFPKEAAAAQIGVALPSGGPAKDAKPKMDPAERLKRRKQFALVGFMMTFMLFSVGGSIFGLDTKMGALKLWSSGALLGAIAAAIGWFSG